MMKWMTKISIGFQSSRIRAGCHQWNIDFWSSIQSSIDETWMKVRFDAIDRAFLQSADHWQHPTTRNAQHRLTQNSRFTFFRWHFSAFKVIIWSKHHSIILVSAENGFDSVTLKCDRLQMMRQRFEVFRRNLPIRQGKCFKRKRKERSRKW